MKIVDPGHVYRVEEVDAPVLAESPGLLPSQEIRFVRRRDFRGQLVPDAARRPGILSQELVRVLIDRVKFLYAEDPCDEDTEIIGHLRAVLCLFESRAARRTIEKMPMPETADGCPVCHHLLCAHEERGRVAHHFTR